MSDPRMVLARVRDILALTAVVGMAGLGLGLIAGHAIGHDDARQTYQPMACEMRVIDTTVVPTTRPRGAVR